MLSVISHLELFDSMETAELDLLARLLQVCEYSRGDVILAQFDQASRLFILLSGEASIHYKPYDGPSLVVTRVGAGNVVGWSTVLGHAFYTSSVVCETPVRAIAISGRDLQKLIKEHPATGQKVVDRLALSVSARWKNTQMQVKHMLETGKGISSSEQPLRPKKGSVKMATQNGSDPKEEQLRKLLEQLSAYIEQFHGGSVEFMGLEEDVLKVRLGGACLGCPLSPATLHGWVEGTVRQFFPDIKKVVAV